MVVEVLGRLLPAVLLVGVAGAQVLTQRLASVGASEAPAGRLLLLPLVTAVTGLAFPIGVTAYWARSALWTAQQLVLPRLVRTA